MIPTILSRNLVLLILVALILKASINWQECFIKRGKYLLGIVYNGYFQNTNDRIIYENYLRRHHTTVEVFQNNL